VPVVIDLDGVVWLEGAPIPGSAEAVRRLRSAGEEVWFVTNSSFWTGAEQEQRLADCGIDARGRVLTSAMAAARLVAPGERVMVCGGPGLRTALVDIGAEVVEPSAGVGPVDAVLVGFSREFDFDVLHATSAAVRGGARLVGSNADSTYPTPEGLLPGGGALLAAVACASGVEPTIAGKPERPMVELVRAATEGSGGHHAAVIGDRLDTDGRLAAALGWQFVLVRSDASPAVDAGMTAVADLAAAAEVLLR
jgi:4-nitrophenyl phosphatase